MMHRPQNSDMQPECLLLAVGLAFMVMLWSVAARAGDLSNPDQTVTYSYPVVTISVDQLGRITNSYLPNQDLTPGVARPGVTMADLCPVAHTAAVRNVPQVEKNQVYAEYGITSHSPGEFEIDHLISLELGGSNDIKNLWPESYLTKPWNAHVKDRLEDRLHVEVCAGRITLEQAQHDIATDWISTYQRYFPAPE